MEESSSQELIERTINEADVNSRWNPLRGDCSVIAAAIERVFGGELQAVSSVPYEQYFDHVVVNIDGALYDGRGAVSAAQVEDEFINTDDWESREAHWFTVDDISNDRMYDEQAADELEQTLRAARDTVDGRLE